MRPRWGVSKVEDAISGCAQDALAGDERERRLGIEAAVVEGAAGDGAFQLSILGLQQRPDVVEAGKAAGGDHGDGDGVGQRQGGRQIEALQHAVAIDVGVDDGGDAGVLEAPGEIDGGELAGLGPALDRDLAATGIDADRDAARKAAAGLAHQSGVAHGDRAEDDAADALAEPHLDGGEVADAAAELHRHLHGSAGSPRPPAR